LTGWRTRRTNDGPIHCIRYGAGRCSRDKKAIALGKDIHGLYKEFSSFYQAADTVHLASSKARIASIGKTDAQISSQALQIALASKALREHEKELKDILFYSGNAPVWEEMMAERTRLIKERNTLEREEAERKQKDKEAKVAIIMNTLWISGASAIVVPLVSVAFHVITNRGF
jgi:hypothetical protein